MKDSTNFVDSALSKLTFNGVPYAEHKVKESMSRKRRKHTAEYKLRILKEADICRDVPGAVAALLRKEGLYSSCLTEWAKLRDSGALSALSLKRGRKLTHTPIIEEVQRLRKEKSILEEKLRQAELVIDIQKKISTMLASSTEHIGTAL